MTLKDTIELLKLFHKRDTIPELINDLETYEKNLSGNAKEPLSARRLNKLLEDLRDELCTIANDEDNDKINEQELSLADAAYDVLVALAKLKPINDQDTITLDAIENIPEDELIILSTGHHYNIRGLIQQHNTRRYETKRGENTNFRYLYNEQTRKNFSAKDARRIYEKAQSLGLNVVSHPSVNSQSSRRIEVTSSSTIRNNQNTFFPRSHPAPQTNNQWPWLEATNDNERFAKYITYGQENLAKQHLDNQHANLQELLTTTFNISMPETWSGGRTVTGTPFQIALKEGDVEMAQMMKRYFDRLEHGNELMQSQFNEVFPEGVDACMQMLEENTFDFGGIIAAIDSDNEQTIETALAEFRQAFKSLVMTEDGFNPYHLLRAFQFYDEKYTSWNLNQCVTFWSKVVGYTQRFLPACYAQAFAQGIYEIVENGESLCRNFEFKQYRDSFFFPYSLEGSSSGLGFNFAVTVDGVKLAPIDCEAWLWPCFWKIISNKNSDLGNLCDFRVTRQPAE